MVDAKRQRTTGREERKDRLSDLPDGVLLHIMKFMDTKDVFQTNVLSKRWKDLWKRITSLSFSRKYYRRIGHYNKFVSQVLSSRDDSISLFNLKFDAYGVTAPKLLNMVTKYAVSHNVQELTIEVNFNFKNTPNCFDPLIFYCQTLTFLNLSVRLADPPLKLPKSLVLPKLKSLHLQNVGFTCAEPFSTCNLLNTLVIKYYTYNIFPKFLCISNANLSTLKLEDWAQDFIDKYTYQPKIVLSTPNLVSFTFVASLVCKLSSTCDLSSLEEVNIDSTCSRTDCSVVLSWLQVLSNVKILTVSSFILNIILNDLSNLAGMENQPPRLVRLKSLTMKMVRNSMISNKEIIRTVEHLLQNSSPLNRVAVINC